MSTTIDEKVVSIQFDNQRFEKNVSNTMSTLDKLKQKLSFNGASKGLETVNAAAGKVNMSGLSSAVETVHAKFSALEVMGVTALANITNSAVNTGKRMLSALTIDPIKSGFQEYETQINSTQTILANTKSKGSTIDDVNKALEELNLYADKTIYNFTEMTRNIGTFTAAGIELDTSVNAIQGIANLAAVSGSTSQQASTAMYQLSQALASGTVKLMDWNSVVNAGMGGEMFQNALKETSKLLGTGAEQAIKTTGSFRESLREGWLTADVLTETLKKFTTTGATEYIAEYTGESKEAIETILEENDAWGDNADAIDKAAEAIAKKTGKDKEQIKSALDFAKSAEDAATKVKTFTQLWDVMKESAQSGWAQTWKLLVGDFEQAKNLLTPVADFLTGAINKMSEARNKLLESALGKGFTELAEKIKTIAKPIKATTDSVKEVVDSVKNYSDVVNEIIGGKWGNGQERWDSLAKAGYDWAHAQNLVNEELGCSVRYATNYSEATKKTTKSTEEATEAESKQIAKLAELSDAELKAMGYTDEQIKTFDELRKTADKLGLSVEDLIDNVDEIDGRWLMINSFKNVGQSIVKIFKAIGEAWRTAFPPMSGDTLFNIIAGIHRFSTYLVISDKSADNLKDTLSGLFAILDIVLTIVGGPIKIAFKIFEKILGAMNLSILDVTAVVGRAIVKFRDFLDETLFSNEVFTIVVNAIKKAMDAIGGWIKSIKGSEVITTMTKYIKDSVKAINEWFDSLDSSKIIEDFTSGVKKAGKYIGDLYNKVKNSEAFKTLGSYLDIIVEGFKAWLGSLRDIKIINTLYNYIKGISKGFKDWFAGFKEGDVIGNFTAGLEKARKAIGGWFAGLKDTKVFQVLSSYLKDSSAAINEWFENLKGSDNIPRDLILGLVNGIKSGVKTSVSAIVELGKAILEDLKNVLGIHSPSKETYEMGKNLVEGFVNGIKDFAVMLYNLVMSVGTKCIEIIKNLDIGSVVTALVGSSFAIGFVKIASALENLTEPLDGVGDILENAAGVVKNFGGVLKSFSLNVKAKALQTIAISIAILVGSIAVLTFLPVTEVWASIGAIFALAAILGGLTVVMGKFGASNTMDFGKITLSLLGISVAILIISSAMKKLAGINPDGWSQAIHGLLGIAVILVGVMAAFTACNKFGGKIEEVGQTMMKLAGAIAILAIVAILLGKVNPDTLKVGTLVVAALGAICVGLMWAVSKFGKKAVTVTDSLKKVAGAIAILAIVMVLLGKVNETTLKKGLNAIIALGLVVVALMAAVDHFSKGKKNVTHQLKQVAGAIAILAVICILLGKANPATLIKGGIAIAALGAICVGLMAAVKKLSSDGGKVGVTLLMLAGSIAILAGVAVLLGMVSIPNLVKGIVAVAALAAIAVLMAKMTSGAQESKGNIIALAVAVGVMAAAILILSFIDPTKLIAPTIALGIVMGMFSLMLKEAGKISGGMGVMIVMAVVFTLMSAALMILAKMPIKNVMGSAVALSLLMGVLTGVAVLIGKFGSSAGKVIMGALGMAALVGVMALLGLVLAMMSALKVTDAVANAQALSLMMLTLTVVAIAMSVFGSLATNIALGALGMAALVGVMALLGLVLAMMTAMNVQNAITNAMALNSMMITLTLVAVAMSIFGALVVNIALGALGMAALVGVMALLALVLAMMSAMDIQNAIVNAAVLSSLMVVLSDVAVKLALVGPLALIGVAAMYALTALIAGIGVMAVAVGGLMEMFPSLETFIDAGIPILVKLANGVGQIISGFAEGLVSGLPEIGAQLGLFMLNATPFIIGAKMVDESVLAGVGVLTAAILALTAADLIEGIASFIGGGTSFSTLGTELSAFIMNALPFILLSKQIDPSIMEGVKALAEAVLILTATDVLDGLTSWLTGGSSLADFGAQLGDLGTNLNQFITNLGTFDEGQIATVKCAGEAIKALASAAATIPNEGGLWGAIVGENSLAKFSSELPGLGSDLSKFITNLGTFEDGQLTTVKVACDAIKALAEAAGEIPNDGGLWGAIVGENSLSKFSGDLPGLGTNLSKFITNLGTFEDGQLTTVKVACKAIKALAEAANAIPNDGGLWGAIVGDNSLSDFADDLPDLGSNLSEFVTNLGIMGDDKLDTVNTVVKVIKSLAKIASDDMDFGNISDFGKKIKDLGKKISDFASEVDDVGSESISSAITKTEDLVGLAKTIAGTSVSSLSTFGNSLKKVAKEGVKGFTKEFTSETPKTEVKKGVKSILDAGIKGAKEKKDDVKTAFEDVGEAAAKKLATKSNKSEAKTAGKDLVTGFANGITAQTFEAEAKAKAMAKAALEAAKEALGIESPSKEFYAVGSFAGQGLTNALSDYESKSYKSGYSVAEYAKNGLSKALSKVNDLLNGDMDAQPTIRPVLDLSDVTAGANSIGGLFNNPSVGVKSNIRAISSMMNGNQNGVNKDVVSAIDKLRKDIGNINGTSYNFNGVSYNADSDVANAIQTLTRAAMIERRI